MVLIFSNSLFIIVTITTLNLIYPNHHINITHLIQYCLIYNIITLLCNELNISYYVSKLSGLYKLMSQTDKIKILSSNQLNANEKIIGNTVIISQTFQNLLNTHLFKLYINELNRFKLIMQLKGIIFYQMLVFNIISALFYYVILYPVILTTQLIPFKLINRILTLLFSIPLNIGKLLHKGISYLSIVINIFFTQCKLRHYSKLNQNQINQAIILYETINIMYLNTTNKTSNQLLINGLYKIRDHKTL